MVGLARAMLILVTALWLGGLVWIGFILAPYLFSLAAKASDAVPNTTMAAEMIGPLLELNDRATILIAPALILSLLALRTWRVQAIGGRFFLCELLLAVALACGCLNHWYYSPHIHDLRQQLGDEYGAFHLADKSHPVYQQFSQLHGASMIVFVITVAAAMMTLICLTQLRQVQPQPGRIS